MRGKLIVATVLVAAVAAPAGAAAASPAVLDSRTTTSAYSVASVILAKGYSRYGISVETAPSRQLVGLKWSVDCSKGSEKKRVEAKASQKAPYTVWLDAGVKGGACDVLGTATRDFRLKGKLTVKVLGTK